VRPRQEVSILSGARSCSTLAASPHCSLSSRRPAMHRHRLPHLALLTAFATLTACARHGAQTAPVPAGAFDVVIENGRIVDGTGAGWFYGDVGIRGDRIAAITPRGMLRTASAKTRVDARNLIVAPGFIDIQDQSGG